MATLASLLSEPKIQLLDSAGLPISGGTITFYAAGTTTKQAAYADAGGTTPLANPITLDAGGFSPAIYIGTQAYRVVAKNAVGSTVWDVDNVATPGLLAINSFIAQKGIAGGLATLDSGVFVPQTQLNYKLNASTSINRQVLDKLSESVSVKDFGALGNGSTNDTAAIQAAFDYAYASNTQVSVYFPAGTYKTHRIVYRGESFHGDSPNSSVVKGFPGEDVFATNDPADVTTQAALQYTTIYDIQILLDASINTAGLFPNRVAGANTTAGFSWQIGNCAFAFPNRDGSKNPGFIGNHMLMSRLKIETTNGPNQTNGTCGIFSNIPFNDSTFNEIQIRQTQFGLVNAPGTSNINLFAPDANHFEKLGLYTLYPFIWYGGGHTTLTNVQMYAATVGATGPFIINPPAATGPYTGTFQPPPAGWEWNGVYTENASSTTGCVMQVDGVGHTFIGGSFKQDAGNACYIQWNASYSRCISMGLGNITATPAVLIVTGNSNLFEIQTQQGFPVPPVQTTGTTGNRITVTGSAVNGGFRPLSASPSHPQPLGVKTGDFAISGMAPTPFNNADDLVLTVEDFPSSMSGGILDDATAPYTGTYMRVANGAGAFQINRADNFINGLTIGSRFPATTCTVYICSRVPAGAASQVIVVTDSTGANMGSGTINMNSGWAIQGFNVDFTSAVSWVQITANNNSLSSAEDVAWIAIVPLAKQITVQGNATAIHFISSSARPTIVPGSATGTGATANIATGSTDHAGNIAVTVGTSPGTGQTLVVTFAATFPSPGAFVTITPTNGAALGVGFIVNGSPSTAGFTITSNGALAAGQSYSWNYTVGK